MANNVASKLLIRKPVAAFVAAGLFFEPNEIDMKTIAPLLLLVGVFVFGVVAYFQYQAMGPADDNEPAKQPGLIENRSRVSRQTDRTQDATR